MSGKTPTKTAPAEAASQSNFIKQRIEHDLERGTYAQRRWAGEPGPAPLHANAPVDPAKIRTRFPPEPNGYLHIGHAKSICLNFGLAEEYGGTCHMRFDDTNPEKEDQEFVDGILDTVHWLGYHWGKNDENLYHASDYFQWMHDFAVELIKHGDAYVDSQSPEDVARNRGTFQEPGKNSPFRERTVAENLALFAEMRQGKYEDGTHVLRAKIDMASPNINMRDPALYRIKNAEHHRTGDKWHIYPMYSYAHPIEDALENITHSLCTLEFEDQRPFYDWVLERIASFGLLQRPLPQQIEFARLNLTYTITSKRYLKQLVEEGRVDGWDDPRMPTIVGMRRRGFPPSAIRLFMERAGVSKADQWIDDSILEDCVREVLNETAVRRIGVLDPVRLVITNYPDGQVEDCDAPNHPQKPELGRRTLPFSRELWIEREDFMEVPTKGYFRLFPGSRVRLKYAYVVECTGVRKDESGKIIEILCEYFPETKSGTPGAESIKTRGTIHWISTRNCVEVEIQLISRLFREINPGSQRDVMSALSSDSMIKRTALFETEAATSDCGQALQLERHGYFVRDVKRTSPMSFIRTTTLRDPWAIEGKATTQMKTSMDKSPRAVSDWYEDDSELEREEYPVTEYDLTAETNDFNTKTIFDFIESGSVIIPGFQRNYVWDQKAASKLIESVLIKLPVPQVFLYEETKNRYLVIDGQQRLMTVYYFIKQRFPRIDKRAELRRVFSEKGRIPDEVLHDDKLFTDFTLQLRTPNSVLKNKFHGLKYSTLGEYKQTFDLRPIRSTIVKENVPQENHSSVYEIFNRLNTGGMNLKAQEIRSSLFHSEFYEMLVRVNGDPLWRNLTGLPDRDLHMKDVEFLLRAVAMLINHLNYAPSMTRFLNDFSGEAKTLKGEKIAYLESLLRSFFVAACNLDPDAFHSNSGRFSAAIFEAVFVAVCEPLLRTEELVGVPVDQAYVRRLKQDPVFTKASQKRTTDKTNVANRLSRAKALLTEL